MVFSAILAAASVSLAHAAPQVEVAPNPAPAASPDASTGVISYPPAFFAEVGPTTALDMVMRLPGFAFDKGAAVRGLSGSGGNVLIDGEAPVAKNDSLEEILRRIPVSAVLRVDVIRGSAPGIDMQGRTVIANIIRKSGSGFKGAATLTSWPIYDGRVLNGIRAEGEWRWGPRMLELSTVIGSGVNDQAGDGYRVRVGPTGQTQINSKVDYDAQGTRNWLIGAYETPLAKGRLRVNGAYMLNSGFGELYDRLSFPGSSREYQYSRDDRLQAELGGRFTRRFGETQMEALVFQQWNNVDSYTRFESPSLNRLFLASKDVGETVGRMNLRRKIGGLNVEAGVEGAYNTLDSATRLTVNSGLVRLPAANVQVNEKRGEVFTVVTGQISPTLSWEGGLRQEFSTVTSTGDLVLEKSLSFTKPRLAVTWAPDSKTQVRMRVEREVSQLNFDDFVASNSVANTGAVIAGNPDLSPMQAWVSEAALERRFWQRGAAILTLRHYALTDVIDRAPIYLGTLVADAPANIGQGTKDEIQFSLAVPLDRLGLKLATLKGQATVRHTEVTDPTTHLKREISSVTNLQPAPSLSAVRPSEWDLLYTQDLPKLKSNWGFSVVGGYRDKFFRLSEVETDKMETWFVLFTEVKFTPDTSVRIEVQAPFNRDVVRIRDVWSGPRNSASFSYTDYRSLQWDGAVQIKLRKTLG